METRIVSDLIDGSVVTTEFIAKREGWVSTVKPLGGIEREIVRQVLPIDEASARLDHSRILRELTADTIQGSR